MCKTKVLTTVLALLVFLLCSRARPAAQVAPAESQPPTPKELTVWIPGAIDRELFQIQDFSPTVDIYTQLRGQDALDDDAFIGRLSWKPTLAIEPIELYEPSRRNGRLSKVAADRKHVPPELAALLFPDINGLSADRYAFTFQGYEVLDGVKCLVVSVEPARGQGFRGKLWLENSQLVLIRFSGGSTALDKAISAFLKQPGRFHVDSWRAPGGSDGSWIPSTSFVLEEVRGTDTRNAPRIRMSARVWGYALSAAKEPHTYTNIVVDRAIQGDEIAGQLPTPIQVERELRRNAENNILEWLASRGVIASDGALDRVVCGVANRLLLVAAPPVDEPIRCRTLLVSSLDVIVVGRTLLISRGLIDSAVDEGCLSRVLAHFVGHLLANDSIDGTLAFADRLMRPDRDVLETLHQSYSAAQEEAADKTAVKLLNNSVYQGKLANSTLFFQAIADHSNRLPGLLPASFLTHLADRQQIMRFGIRVTRPPVPDPDNPDQLMARPLGSRVKVDSWSSNVELLPIPSDPIGPGEKLMFAITPLRPYVGSPRRAADTQ